jgi:hypothetical protein
MSWERLSWDWGMAAGPTRAALGGFPYPHRTVAEIDAEQDARRLNAEAVMKGPGKGDWDRWLGADTGVRSALSGRSPLPTAPCFHCGARAACEHRRAAA